MSQTKLYQQVVEVTNNYLGPAAERFIARQVQNHLKKRPEDLSQLDLQRLIDWIQIAVSLLTDDTDIIEEYIAELNKLTIKQSEKSGSN